MKTIAVARFPGTNCDRDVWKAVETVGAKPMWWWHEDEPSLEGIDGIVVPGGFSYGDYLRCGALASRSPVMRSIRKSVDKGLPVLGICNGFQILCESGLLPGALVRNESLRFIDRWIEVQTASSRGFWGEALKGGQAYRLPIAHGEGRFYVEESGYQELVKKSQVWLTYSQNPNGSLHDIAGVMNEKGNVAALMPHPERAMKDWMGSESGVAFFKAFLR